MSKLCNIYCITNMRDGKRYVGSSKHIVARWSQHRRELSRKRHHSEHLQRAWTRDGERVFDFSICTLCEERELPEREQHYIDFFSSQDRSTGYNISPRVDRTECADETRVKIGNAHRGKPKTKEHNEKVAASKRGVPRPQHVIDTLVAYHRGRKQSPEVIAKRAARQRGQKRSAESIAKTAAGLRGKKMSPQACINIGNASRGRKHSEETKAKIRLACRRIKPSAESIAKRIETLRARKRLASPQLAFTFGEQPA